LLSNKTSFARVLQTLAAQHDAAVFGNVRMRHCSENMRKLSKHGELTKR